ncbi:MAG: amino acid permease [Acidobacteria bacterium]|nr:amino acid permease [Acidobacteriota bacterium]
MTVSAPSLVRRLGPIDGASIIVSNVIGSGIFLVPALVAVWVPNVWAMLGAWVVGGLLAFAGAMAYAELAARLPRAGGEYVYLREAFGPVAGFLTGWTSFVAGFSGAIAAGAVGLATYLGRLVPAAADATPFATLPLGVVTLSVSPRALVALAAIAALTVVHIAGLGPGRIVQNFLAAAKVGFLVALVALGFAVGSGSVGNFTAPSGDAVSPALWLLALIPIMFSYSGWNAAAYVAEEIREPERNAPIAMAVGTVAVVGIYVLLNLLYVYAMPVAEMGELASADARVIDAAGARLFGDGFAALLAAASVVMIAASLSAMVLAGPRVYFAMARDGQFFEAAARVHPRLRTPVAAIVAQSAWSGLLVLAGTFDQLLLYTGFAVVMFAGAGVAALFVVRRRDGAAARPVSLLRRVAPAVFVAASAAMLVNAVWREPVASGAGVLLITAGLPFYFVFRRRAAQGDSPG